MGYRTVVVLINDQAHEWMKDPELGKKISMAMNGRRGGEDLGYGRVVECCHADQQTLAVIDSYNFTGIAHGYWSGNETDVETQRKLLADAASKIGYKLIKDSKATSTKEAA